MLTIDSCHRHRLIESHAAIGRSIALRIARRAPRWVNADDLVSAAMVGLTEAAERFDSGRGEPFLAFAAKRIRGAVLDELRSADPLSRRERADTRRLGEAVHRLEQRLGRAPEEVELAQETGLGLAACRDALAAKVTMVALDAAEPTSAADERSSPVHALERAQLAARAAAAMANLDARDLRILTMYYEDGLTYGQIGQALEVTESRICQLHARALARLRHEVRGADADAADGSFSRASHRRPIQPRSATLRPLARHDRRAA